MRYGLICICILLVGCAGPYSGPAQYRSLPSGTAPPALPAGQAEVRQALLTHYHRWRGVPYRLGGTGRSGIDCSAFTQLTYQDQFNRLLPRTTVGQARQGQSVERQSLQAGDLVFFKTDVKVRHVGIYMGQGEFLHASTSRGVVISRLNNPYWQQHYWQARRLY